MLTRIASRAIWNRLSLETRVMLGAFGVFAFVYPFATFLLSFDLMPFGMEWMSSLLLAMLGTAAGAWLVVNFGNKGAALGLVVFAAGVALEWFGANTGFPFGRYSYTGVLVPELPGKVPLAIGFAWVWIVVSGLATARWLMRRGALRRLTTRTWWALPAAGALLAVGLDLLLEPVAFHIKGYWLWEGGGLYYGVPLSNFVAWLGAAFLLGVLVTLRTSWSGALRWEWVPVVLFAMNAAMFGVVNLAHGFWLAGLVALGLLALLAAATSFKRLSGLPR